ncbi:hypothetical protein [Bradyrhizobium sp. CB2312]|uniref:hypothetical protein n=1 Tax=Bradyrhizobium sp. CB2312 TaxID=3039155 RepID=UPI0024B04AB7|nr:hypothetical protein [Bradyrhizobium sp. CB2312]WFU75601.1 hypothetical protein QA642_17225 [Bradyrhizobium sp. CB2312]
MAATGPASFAYLVAEVAKNYSFDDFVTQSGAYFQELFASHVTSDGLQFAAAVGWLDREDRPAAYMIDLVYGDIERLRSEVKIDGEPINQLMESHLLAFPPPDIEEVKRTGWPLGVPLDARDAQADLLHLAEIQRRQKSLTGRYIGIWPRPSHFF